MEYDLILRGFGRADFFFNFISYLSLTEYIQMIAKPESTRE